ncbi:MAG: nitroreductase family protein [Chloroflexi bacterium]|nr:nitroreductase family protein [Chloroflexota bacterium]
MIRDLVVRNRSIRRFDPAVSIDRATLRELVDLARLSASSRNLQPLKYILSAEPDRNAVIFEQLAWAGYLTDWDGPDENERPAAYIIILGDRAIAEHINCDHGIAAQSILLGAAERGLGGCIIGSVQRDPLRHALDIPEQLDILLVIALGKPAETIVIEPVGPDGAIEFWRDETGVHHVPKRALDEIIIG